MKKVSQTLWLGAVVIAVVISLGTSVGFAQYGSTIETTTKKTAVPQKKKPILKKKTVAKAKPPAPKSYQLKAGAKFRARINEELNSKTSKVGDTFTATVVDNMYSEGGELVIPDGSIINGRVTEVRQAKRGGDPGTIDVVFTSLRLPNRKTYPINGTLTDLSSDASSDDEGQVSGDKMKNRKIIFIGGGAAGGAIIGAIAGGGKGTAIGAIIGAGAGILGERLTKGEDAKVKSGTEFGIYLNKTIYLPKYIPTSEQ
jgi:hypothetical protein